MIMKHIAFCGLLLLSLVGCEKIEGEVDNTPPSPVLAFPGAEGGGAYTTGGRGGQVYHVTTLEDDGKHVGSLRHILKEPGAKIVVFDVAGVIELKSQLNIEEGAVTIAGQTAPGGGICIAGFPVVIKTSNVIIRFVRFRMGDKNAVEGDALSCIGRKNILIDHCSFSWSTDECVSCYGNENFTLQYCFITESLRKSVHLKGGHGYGGIWGGKNATFHHNLLAHHDSRNPRFDHDYVDNTCKGPIDHVNNVIYNWGGNSAYGGEGANEPRKINMVANYYKYGPATSKKNRIVEPTHSCSSCAEQGKVIPGLFYVADNYVFGYNDVTADNWMGVQPRSESVKAQCKADARWETKPAVTPQTAEAAYEKVLAVGGASLMRDKIDARIVDEVRLGKYTYKGSNGSQNGLIDSQEDVGGWPTYTGTALIDTDKDGIPDDWENTHGLDRLKRSDALLYTLDKNYTNIEVYLNELVQHLY